MSAGLPNELVCLAARLVEGAEAAVADTQLLPPLLGAVAQWRKDFVVPGVVEDMGFAARALQFDAKRLALLVQAHDAALRRVYSLTLYAVDNLRLVSAVLVAPEPNALGNAAVQAALHGMADMQEAIEALYAGDKTLGN